MLARHLLNTALRRMLYLLSLNHDALGLVLLLVLLILLLLAHFLISLHPGRRSVRRSRDKVWLLQ